MAHYRRKIREEIVSRLLNGVPDGDGGMFKLDVGPRVFPQRPEALWETEYPCVLVYFEEDRIVSTSSAKDILNRDLVVNIDLIHLSRAGLDDLLDDLSWQTECILFSDLSLGLSQVNYLELETTNLFNDNTEGEQARGVSRLRFVIHYWDYALTMGRSSVSEFKSYGKEIIGQIGDGAKIEMSQTIR